MTYDNSCWHTLTPIAATPPFTYVVRTPGQPPLVQTDTVPIKLVSLSLSTASPQVITVTASNAGGTVGDTHAILIEPRKVYLPIVVRN